MTKGDTAASRTRARARRVAGRARNGWIVLATFLAVLALSGAMMAAFEHSVRIADDLSRVDERQRVSRLFGRQMRASVEAQRVQVTWDAAMRNAVLASNPRWQDTYLGGFFWNNFDTDRVFLVRPDGTLLRGWSEGKVTVPAAYGPIRGEVEALIAQAAVNGLVFGKMAGTRRLADTDWPVDANGLPLTRWAGAVTTHEGKPAMVTVMAIVPDEDASLLRATPNYIATVRFIDRGMVRAIGDDLLLPDLALAPQLPPGTGHNAVRLHGADGQALGWLYWTPHLPGPTIGRRTAPLLVAYMLFFMAVVAGGVAIVRRMHRATRELVASEAQAQHNALHDAMSGLPNRVHYMQRLRLELAKPAPGDVFVAYVDLDGFKTVNDTLGHHVGDELVRQVAKRLRRHLAPGDFISRFGGDEFVVMRRAAGGMHAADALGREIMALMGEPFIISGNTVDVTCSCGISWGPEQSEDPGELLRRADIALYRAKQRGRARYRRFTRAMDASLTLRREMETELRRAIQRDELSVAYQPIVALDPGLGGQVEGFEALLRWNHPERGEIRPGMFVPVAEQGGLMIALGNWMLDRVFTECRDWPRCDISVNLSPLQVMAPDFLDTMAGHVARTGIEPARVVLEITEGVMLDRSDHVIGVLRALGQMGFRIALDDFGIGYSSLSYLRSFQFDRIKIDRSFVQNIESDGDAQSILCAIASLGRTLRMKVVAEGVETETQRHLVQAAGCDLVQGHLFWQALSTPIARALIGAPDRQSQAGSPTAEALQLAG